MMSENHDLKRVIAVNIAALRRKNGMTQLELAEKLNYSDKAVSKWESGASVPDVGVLKEIAQLFGVSIDWLVTPEHDETDAAAEEREVPDGGARKMTHAHMIITLLSVSLVWLIATACFVFLTFSGTYGPLWLSFIWALPVSFIVLIVLNTIWGAVRKNYVYISCLLWTVLAAVYLTLLESNLWLLFVIGIPGETIVILWAGMKRKPPESDDDIENDENGQ